MVEPVLVADSSPLIALARIDHLHLLQRLAAEVWVSSAFWNEVTEHREPPGAVEVAAADWLVRREPERASVEPLRILVDPGEAEAIALAGEGAGRWLLADNSRARQVAQRLEIRCIGTIGILRRAKPAGLIPQVRPLLEALEEAGIYLTPRLIEAVLEDVGETERDSRQRKGGES